MSEQDAHALPDFPLGLKQAMVLQTLAVLYRRHHGALPLRLVELHPGGGMYHCLGLMVDPDHKQLCMFNLNGSSLELKGIGTPRPPSSASRDWHSNSWRYPFAYFHHGGGVGLAEQLELRLGIEHVEVLPSATAGSIGLSVLAELAQRRAFSERVPMLQSGWFDSSGLGGCEVKPWVGWVPELLARCEAATDWPEQLKAAGRIWALASSDAEQQRLVAVDLGSGGVYRDGEFVGSLWDRYQKGEGIRAMAWWLESLWTG